MKRRFIRYLVLLLVLLLMAAVVGCSELKEVPSVDNPDIIVFQTGNALPFMAVGVLFIGLIVLALGIFTGWHTVRDYAKERKKLKWLGNLSLAIIITLGGAVYASVPFFISPYSENITIDKSLMTIESKKNFFLRDETLRISFADISYIEWSQQYHISGETGGDWEGEVVLVLYDGTEVELSDNGPEAQRDLARRIAEFTNKELVENY